MAHKIAVAVATLLCLAGSASAADFPLKDDERAELGDHRRMASDASLSKDGTVTIKTKTWTDKKFKGFTGGVTLFILDKDGNYLHHTSLQRYGVDGRGIPGKASKRDDIYTEKVPEGVAQNAAAVVLWHGLTPKDRLNEQVEAARKITKAVKDIIRATHGLTLGRVVRLGMGPAPQFGSRSCPGRWSSGWPS